MVINIVVFQKILETPASLLSDWKHGYWWFFERQSSEDVREDVRTHIYIDSMSGSAVRNHSQPLSRPRDVWNRRQCFIHYSIKILTWAPACLLMCSHNSQHEACVSDVGTQLLRRLQGDADTLPTVEAWGSAQRVIHAVIEHSDTLVVFATATVFITVGQGSIMYLYAR